MGTHRNVSNCLRAEYNSVLMASSLDLLPFRRIARRWLPRGAGSLLMDATMATLAVARECRFQRARAGVGADVG